MRIRLLINKLVVILLCCCMAVELTAVFFTEQGQAVYGLLYEQFKGQAYRTEL